DDMAATIRLVNEGGASMMPAQAAFGKLLDDTDQLRNEVAGVLSALMTAELATLSSTYQAMVQEVSNVQQQWGRLLGIIPNTQHPALTPSTPHPGSGPPAATVTIQKDPNGTSSPEVPPSPTPTRTPTSTPTSPNNGGSGALNPEIHPDGSGSQGIQFVQAN